MTTAAAKKADVKNDVQQVLGLIAKFSDLLLRETSALRRSDFKEVDSLQADKRIFAHEYHAAVTVLCARKEEIAALDLPLREKLVRARTEFTIILNDNLKTLDMTRDSTKRLVNRILDLARQSVTADKQTHYSAKGKTQAYKSSMLSLSVDQKL